MSNALNRCWCGYHIEDEFIGEPRKTSKAGRVWSITCPNCGRREYTTQMYGCPSRLAIKELREKWNKPGDINYGK